VRIPFSVQVMVHTGREVAAPVSEKKHSSWVMIHPGWGYGEPCIYGSGMRVEIIAENFSANPGISIAEVAEDFALTEQEALEALRWHVRYREASKRDRTRMRDEAEQAGLEWKKEYDTKEKP
jgi:uncharacterized protein (DUF433 family)